MNVHVNVNEFAAPLFCRGGCVHKSGMIGSPEEVPTVVELSKRDLRVLSVHLGNETAKPTHQD